MMMLILAALLLAGSSKGTRAPTAKGSAKGEKRYLRDLARQRKERGRQLAVENGVDPALVDLYDESGLLGQLSTGDFAGAGLTVAAQNEGYAQRKVGNFIKRFG